MFGRICTVAFVLALTGTSAYAKSACTEPVPPEPVNGQTATEQQLGAASHAANLYIHAADDYVACLQQEIDAQKAASKDGMVPPDVQSDFDKKTTAIQQTKERVGGQFHGALALYCMRKDANPADCKPAPQ